MGYKLSVIISTYNHGAKLFSLLDYLDGQKVDEIVVIDDHDNKEDEIKKKLKSLNTKSRLIVMDEPYGPWATKSIGIKVAKNDYILHLDGDCEPLSRDIKSQHLKWLKKGYLFVFGNAIFDGKSLLTNAFYVRYCLSSNKYFLEKPQEFDGYHIIAVSGNNFSLNRKFLYTKEIPNLGLYAGDDLYFTILNMRKTKEKAIFDPTILVKHKHPLTTRKLIKKYYTYGVGSGINRKLFGKLDYYTEMLMKIHLSRLPIARKKLGLYPTLLFFVYIHFML
ncbi:MAG: glycosyl transferase family 2 [Candidatus Parvarchaeum acidophilus ARMAN-5]|uniref:Glycosyl transferase family 2 n=1 Tax=Candidatus Parvarchaeum acidophilus ARMAN-5 TaxID=662762 RepID=D6GV31_PARA5|nr:MAG: glycosyl transferase family 2 [Candidatus Parvarchaeum acidophilus ARMAN-5]